MSLVAPVYSTLCESDPLVCEWYYKSLAVYNGFGRCIPEAVARGGGESLADERLVDRWVGAIEWFAASPGGQPRCLGGGVDCGSAGLGRTESGVGCGGGGASVGDVEHGGESARVGVSAEGPGVRQSARPLELSGGPVAGGRAPAARDGGHGSLRGDSQRVFPVGEASVVGGVGVVPGQTPRGPNYWRNKATREKKREKKRAALGAAALGLPVGAEGLVELQVEVKRLQLERQKAREEGLAARRRAGIDHVAEAVALLKQSVECEKLAEHGRVASVAGWAATVTSSSASSLARSAPSSVPSLASVKSAGESALVKRPLTRTETAMVSHGGWSKAEVLAARKKVGRELVVDDITVAGFPKKFTSDERKLIACAAVGVAVEQPYY